MTPNLENVVVCSVDGSVLLTLVADLGPGVGGDGHLLALDEDLDLGEGGRVVTLGGGEDHHQVAEENTEFTTVT